MGNEIRFNWIPSSPTGQQVALGPSRLFIYLHKVSHLFFVTQAAAAAWRQQPQQHSAIKKKAEKLSNGEADQKEEKGGS